MNEYTEMKLGKELDLQERIMLKKAKRDGLYSLTPPFPKTNFLMELSNACNHACIFCAHQKMRRPTGTINREKAFDILEQAYALGTREVGFYATGEPFLVPDLPEYIAKAKETGYTYVYLTSNGSLATPERIRAVTDAGLDSIKFSINAPQRRLYEFIHGKDDFDTVMENLRYVNEYRAVSKKQYKIYVTGILTRFTEHLRDKYYEVFQGLADQIVFKYVYNQGGYMPEIEDYLRCDCDHEKRRRCNLPFDAVSVTKECYLSIENADYENMLIVADLNQVSLHDGWYGDVMRDMRRRFMEDDLKGTLCDGCVHHTKAGAWPLMKEYSGVQGEYQSDGYLVRERIQNTSLTVYVPMVADIIHPGHINIIKTAAKYGKVIVGLFTDEAVASYKRVPYMSYGQRKTVIENIRDVYRVIPQKTRDYEENLRACRPDFMVHGKDWREGPLADVRAKAVEIMAQWGGQVIEPDYTRGVSSTQIQKQIAMRAGKTGQAQDCPGDRR